MELKFFCPYWGMKPLPYDAALKQIKAAGYDGVELAIDPDVAGYEEAAALCNQHGLLLIAQHPYAKGSSPAALLADYRNKLERIAALGPMLINCHTGRDYYTIPQNLPFLEAAETISNAYGIPIAHEIHRGRFTFCTTSTIAYLDAFSELKLTADFSHWCVVSESLLEAQQGVITRVVPHCIHLHARVGFAQGPQVPHPAAPEYRAELAAHLNWWQQVANSLKQKGAKQMTVTCEFGPPPYLPALPFTGAPVASQWEINLFMKNYLSEKLLT